MCVDAQRDPNFTGECLTKERPTSDEYEDYFQEINSKSTTETNDAIVEYRTLVLPPRSCPPSFRRDHRGRCRRVNLINENYAKVISFFLVVNFNFISKSYIMKRHGESH